MFRGVARSPTRPNVCLASDTLITMADGTTKRVDELRVGDKVLAVNPYTFEAIEDEVSYSDSETELWDSVRDEWTFDDGSTVTTVHPHEFYNVRTECMEYIADFEIGDRVRKQDGTTAVYDATNNNSLATLFANTFEVGWLGGQTKCVPLSPKGDVLTARPKFRWRHDAAWPSRDYPVFRLRVWRGRVRGGGLPARRMA